MLESITIQGWITIGVTFAGICGGWAVMYYRIGALEDKVDRAIEGQDRREERQEERTERIDNRLIRIEENCRIRHGSRAAEET